MPNVIHVSKLGSQTALFYLTQGDAQTKAVTFVVPRNDGAENLDGLVWMLQIVNAAGQNDATGFLAEVKGSNLHMTWVCGGVLTAAAGRASIQLCGYDSTGAMQWCSGQYYIEVLERMSQTFSGEETEVMSELQILVDAAVRKAAEAADEADVAAGEARGAAASATAAANNANQAAQRAETAADNADAAAEDADRAASNAVSASEVANDAAAAAVNAAREANASATHADSMAGAAQSAANSASAAAGEANAAASNANAAAADTKAATLAVNAAIKTAQDAANEATKATAAASASSTEADAAAQRASSAATNAINKAAEAGTAANAATNAASNANAATSAANTATSAANTAATAANNAAGEAAAAKNAATTAAANADTAASNANAATSAANAAAKEAQAAAADVEAAKSAANTAAANADTAASEANSAAASAKSAASSALNAYSVASAAAARAETVANMTVEAETLNPGSQATAQYKDGKLTLGIPRGEDGSGGAGMPAGEAPYQMLATGPDGKTQWVDRTHYDYPAETLIPLHDMEMKNGYKAFTEPFESIPTPGRTYHITYYGYHYDVVAEEWMDGDVRCISLGNKNLIGGYISQEPFIFVFYADGKQILGAYGYFTCSANKDSIAVSIESTGVLKKLDPKFLPEGSGGGSLPTGGEPYKQLVTDGEGNAVWEDRLAHYDPDLLTEILPETEALEDGDEFAVTTPLSERIEAGKTYTVMWNGVEYNTTAKELDEHGNIIIVLGNLGGLSAGDDTGEPFAIADYYDLSGGLVSLSAIAFDESTSLTLSISKKGGIKKIDPKYFADGDSGEPYKQLATDGNGNAVWVDRLAYDYKGIVPVYSATLTMKENSGGVSDAIYKPFGEQIVPGRFYVMKFDEEEHQVVAEVANQFGAVTITKIAAQGQHHELTIYSYSVPVDGGIVYGQYEISGDAGDVEVEVLTVGTLTKRIDPKYLPKGLPGETETVLLDEASLLPVQSGMFLLPIPLSGTPDASQTFTVTYNGVDYTMAALETFSEIGSIIAIGNVGLLELGELTDEPFLFVVAANGGPIGDMGYGLLVNIDGAETVTLSVKGKTLVKVDPKFLPEGVGYEKEDGSVHSIALKYLPDYLYGQEGDMSEVLPEIAIADGIDGMLDYGIFTPFTAPIIGNKEYVVTYNGEEFRCTSRPYGAMDKPCVGDGNLEEYPFYIVYYGGSTCSDGEKTQYGGCYAKDPGATISIRNGGILRKIDPKFLPPVSDVVLTSPNGTKYRLTVADDGTLGTVAAE